jgi:hypothetical protein
VRATLCTLLVWAALAGATSPVRADPAPAAAVAASEAVRYHYLLPNPIAATTELGKVGKVLLFGVFPGWGWIVKPYLVGWLPTHSWGAVMAMEAGNLPGLVPSFWTQSAGYLKAKQALVTSREQLQDLSRVRGVQEIRLVTGGEFSAGGIDVSVRKKRLNVKTHFSKYESQSLAFIVTDRPLDPKQLGRHWNPKWGEPILLDNLKDARLRVSLSYGDPRRTTSSVFWEPTIEEIFAKDPAPSITAGQWREELRAGKAADKAARKVAREAVLQSDASAVQKARDWTKNLLSSQFTKSVRIDLTLVSDAIPGGERALTTLVQGSAAQNLLKNNALIQLKDQIKFVTGLSGVPVSENALPLKEAIVIPRGEACTVRDLLGQVTGSRVQPRSQAPFTTLFD